MNDLMTLTTLAAEINLLHDAAEQSAASAVQYAARCGAKLNEAKQQCGHGEWLPWLEANCKVSHAQAKRYMKLANEIPELIDESNSSRVRYLCSARAAMAYLSASDEVKERVEAAEEPVTEKQIKTWEKEYQLAVTERDGYKSQAEYHAKQAQQYVMQFHNIQEELRQKVIEEVGKSQDDRIRMIEQENKRLEYVRQLEQEEFTRKEQELKTDKLYAERQLRELQEQQKKAVAAGVEAELKRLDGEITRKRGHIAHYEKELEGARQKFEREAGELAVIERRNRAREKVNLALISISAELFDAADDAYPLTDAEREQWAKTADQLANGKAVIDRWLEGVDHE